MGISFLLFLVALAIRWPKLFEIPKFRSNELDITLKLVAGQAFPLINQHSHIGALSNYIHAIAFRLLGMHYWVPGLITVLAGSATIALVYLWGKRVVSSGVALIGAILLSMSVYHIYFLSHVPWSNCLTPFFISFTLLTFFKGTQEGSVTYLVLAAFLFGLSFQTHPSVITLLPGLAVLFVLYARNGVRAWIKRPAFYLIFPAVMIACANLIVYHGFIQIHRVKSPLAYPTKYALEEHPTASSYFSNTGKAWTLLTRLMAAQVDTKPRIEHWKNPVFLLCALFLLIGLVTAIRKRKYELPILLLSPMLLIPAFNRIYGFCNFGRYEGFILPVALLLIAYAGNEIFIFAKDRGKAAKAIIGIVLSGGFLFLLSYHAYQLQRIYSVLRVSDSSMIFLKTRQLLLDRKYDKRRTAVLIDAFSWHENQMKPFLQSDGWTVDRLTETDTINVKTRNFLKAGFATLPAQVKKFAAHGNSNILVLASPMILKPLLSSGHCESYEGNLEAAELERPNNLYMLLIGHVYYLFRVTSGKPPIADLPKNLTVLLDAAPYIPDDLYRALPNRKSGPLRNPDMPPQTLKALRVMLMKTANALPKFPIITSAICQPEPP